MSSLFCVCTHCGFSEPADPGIPCTMKACLECSGSMKEVVSEDGSAPVGIADISALHGGQASIDYDLCTACEACVTGCIYGAIAMIDGKPVVDPNGCSGCLACALSCPVSAIS